MRKGRHAVLLAALGVACAVGSTRADDPDGADLDPPLRGMTERVDESGAVSFRLPERWRVEPPLPVEDFVAGWGVWVDGSGSEIPHFRVGACFRRGHARAGLCAEMEHAPIFGEEVPGSRRIADGLWEERRLVEARSSLTLLRYVEHDGGVWQLIAHTHPGSWEPLHRHLELVLGTFAVVGEPPRPDAVPGCAPLDADGREVLTDTRNRVSALRAAKAYDGVVRRTGSLLEGEPFVASAPSLILLEDGDVFAALRAEEHGPTTLPEPRALVSFPRWATVAWIARGAAMEGYLSDLRRAAAIEAVRRHFGGPPATWIEEGLARYVRAVEENDGDAAELPQRVRAIWAGAVLRREGTLEDLFARRAATTDELEAWGNEGAAWHWFLRHAPEGEPYRAAYARQLAALRATGVPSRARAAWDGTDLAAMNRGFREWADAWRR